MTDRTWNASVTWTGMTSVLGPLCSMYASDGCDGASARMHWMAGPDEFDEHRVRRGERQVLVGWRCHRRRQRERAILRELELSVGRGRHAGGRGVRERDVIDAIAEPIARLGGERHLFVDRVQRALGRDRGHQRARQGGHHDEGVRLDVGRGHDHARDLVLAGDGRGDRVGRRRGTGAER